MTDPERQARAKGEERSPVEGGLPRPPEDVPPASKVAGDEAAERRARELERQDEEARGLE